MMKKNAEKKYKYFGFGFWIDDKDIDKLNKGRMVKLHSRYKEEDVTIELRKVVDE